MNPLKTFGGSLILMLGLAGVARGQYLLVNGETYTLTEQESPLVVGYVSVINGGSLILEPGSELVIAGVNSSGVSLYLRNNGRLVSSGTKEKPAIIRHLAPNGKVVAERCGGCWLSNVLLLEHTIWDLGVSRVGLFVSAHPSNPDPMLIARNSIIMSKAPRSEEVWFEVYEEEDIEWDEEDDFRWNELNELAATSMIFSVTWESQWDVPTRLVFEDTLLWSSKISALGLGPLNRLEMSRSVVLGSFSENQLQFGVNVIAWETQPMIQIQESRFAGFFAGIGMMETELADASQAIIHIDGSDFSGTELLLADYGFSPLSMIVEDSYITQSFLEHADAVPRNLRFTRCYSEIDPPYTSAPEAEDVIDPLDESPFRHADINGDGRTDFADLRELMKALAGEIGSEPEHDIDNDGDITIRDLALLRSYVDGSLLFLPKVP